MKKLDPQLGKDLADLVGAIQAKHRPTVAAQIQRLQAHLGSTEDLLIDRRKTAWAPGGKSRAAIDRRAQAAPARQYQVSYRSGGAILCTLAEAARLVRRAPATLQVYLSQGRGRYDCTVDDEVLTVKKIAKTRK